jgi:simple sugar transport system ATP-binding protein
MKELSSFSGNQSDNAPALRLAVMSKRYGPTQVLDGIDLSVARGEVVALMGANGAGKSTLAKIASGVVHPDSGRIIVAGREMRLTSPQAARSAGIVIVHQSTDQLGVPGLSVAENLLLDSLCGGGIGTFVGRRYLHQRAKTVAAGIGLDLPLECDFGELGPAHRQLVAIARAAAANASVLILDEPTASLAAMETSRLFDVIDGLRKRGVGILYISHRLADIKRVADRIVVLRNGRLVANQVRPFDLAAAIKAMIGRDLDAIVGKRASGSTGQTILHLDQVRLTPAAEPFDLSIRAGEIVAITGALGSGKSRMLGALFGISRIASGRMNLNGLPWHPKGPADAIAGGVFMAGEDRWRSSLLPPVTPGADVAGTIALPHRRRWFPVGFVRSRYEHAAARHAIEALGIRCDGSSDSLDLLSGGNQQKVVLGRWQAAPCQLLLLDEPFQGIDVGARRDLIAAIRGGRLDSATLIAASDVEEALEVADIVAVMRNQTISTLHDLRTTSALSLLAAISAVEASEAENARELVS